jgi:hypothetical protein
MFVRLFTPLLMDTDHIAAIKTPARILKYLCPNIYRWPNGSYINERMNAVYICIFNNYSPKARWLQAYIIYSLVITEPEVTNCFSINSVLKNNNIYKRCKYNLLHSSAFESNESSCRNLVARLWHFPVLNCQIYCFRHLKGAFVFRKLVSTI